MGARTASEVGATANICCSCRRRLFGGSSTSVTCGRTVRTLGVLLHDSGPRTALVSGGFTCIDRGRRRRCTSVTCGRTVRTLSIILFQFGSRTASVSGGTTIRSGCGSGRCSRCRPRCLGRRRRRAVRSLFVPLLNRGTITALECVCST